ncbi:thioesterase [Pseudohalioglobus sediminis]|uniref:Thioesterase n=1 Tax=Pseudohalioglobus sediminis TaxID=2606449 RepID=A0A5B0WZK7_9GAMM|nr:thioesterase family protein [Pseudohalioglobus sediminis]KAA1191835.1 thioesterase [Pseudohalioglobus sediminis]
MTRKSITLPDSFLFATEYDVLYTDVNSANHLGADRVLPIAMEAQLRFIKQLGYAEATAFEDAGLIMAHAEVQYLAEAEYGDRLRVELAVDNIETKSLELLYRITNLSSDSEMARVATTLLFFDYGNKRVVPVPDQFRRLLDGHSRSAN